MHSIKPWRIYFSPGTNKWFYFVGIVNNSQQFSCKFIPKHKKIYHIKFVSKQYLLEFILHMKMINLDSVIREFEQISTFWGDDQVILFINIKFSNCSKIKLLLADFQTNFWLWRTDSLNLFFPISCQLWADKFGK